MYRKYAENLRQKSKKETLAQQKVYNAGNEQNSHVAF